MDFKEFCGLLQDHVSWYQDSYFLYLLEHVNQATSKDQNGEEELTAVKDNDSDDDVIIVKEVKCKSKEKRIEKTKGEEAIGKNDGDVQVIEGCSKNNEAAKEARLAPTVGEQAAPSKVGPEKGKKPSPLSDGSKSRKRKAPIPLGDSDDSDVDVDKKRKQIKNEKTNYLCNNEKRKFNKESKNESKREIVVDERVGSKEETAKWVLQLPNVDSEEHSEDPDGESDDEDSETHLQLTYGMVLRYSMFLLGKLRNSLWD